MRQNTFSVFGFKKNYLFIIFISGVVRYGNTNSKFLSEYEPVNVSYALHENELSLQWSHPIYQEFEVSINENENKFTRRKYFKNPENTYKVRLPRSTNISMSVCGNGNGKIDQCTKKENFVVPPTIPELREEFLTVEDGQNNTKVVTIPGIFKYTQGTNSYMYITVCNDTTDMKHILDNDDDKIILSKIHCPGTSWVAGRLPTNTSDVTFTVGVGKTSSNPYSNPALTNNYYNICAVLMNEYAKQYSYNVYCAEDDGYDFTTNLIIGGTAIGVVSLAIIITSIVCCVQCCRQKRQDEENRQRMSIAELNPLNRADMSERQQPVARNEIEEQPDVEQPEIRSETGAGQAEVQVQNENIQRARVPLQTSL